MMDGECGDTDASNETKSIEVKEARSNDSRGTGSLDHQNEDMKLHEMGEALEIAENRCNTLKDQLDQMRQLYRERTNSEQPNNKLAGVDLRSMELKPGVKQAIIRQNSEAITTDNSGAAVLTINNILNGITNSINRLSELHTYIEPENSRHNIRKKSKHTKTQENEFVSENCAPNCSASRSSSWIFNDKKKDPKKRSKRSKPMYESGSLTHMKKPGVRAKASSVRDDASSISVRNRKKPKKIAKPAKRAAPRRPGFNSTISSNHLVEIYHNAAVDYADSEELIHEQAHDHNRSRMRATQVELRSKYSRKEVQLPTISTTDCQEDETVPQGAARAEAYRSLSPIKEQEPQIDGMQPHNHPYQARYFCNHGYQTPTISSKMKQVARGYFRNFSCKSIPFCAAKSTSPSHNIGINIQQVMSIIRGRQSTHGISPTLAHNIGVAAERLNDNSFSALVSSFGSRLQCSQPVPCPMQCAVNYQQLQEMAAEVPNDEALGEDAANGCEKNKIEIEIANRKSQEMLSWTIDPNNQNNCTCVKPPGVGFQQVLDKYQNGAIQTANNFLQNSIYTLQQSMYSQRVQRHSNKKYNHIRSVYAQYNESKRKSKKDSLSELSTAEGNSRLPLNGKEKVLKGVLINLHEEFQQLSDKYDELLKIVEDEKHADPDNVTKLEALEKKLNEKELEIQMVMSLYNEVVNLKAQVKALKEKVGMSTAILDTQRHRMKMYQRYYQQQQNAQQQQQPPNQTYYNPNINHIAGYQQYYNPRIRETKANAALHLTKLLRQIQAYREVCKTGGK